MSTTAIIVTIAVVIVFVIAAGGLRGRGPRVTTIERKTERKREGDEQ